MSGLKEIYDGITHGYSNLLDNIANFSWELLFVWCFLLAIDIASGYAKACKQHKVSSNVMRTGIYKKVLDSFAIIAILLMEGVVSYLGTDVPIGSILVGAFCFKEVTSILENAAGSTNALPKMVLNWLEQVKGEVK